MCVCHYGRCWLWKMKEETPEIEQNERIWKEEVPSSSQQWICYVLHTIGSMKLTILKSVESAAAARKTTQKIKPTQNFPKSLKFDQKIPVWVRIRIMYKEYTREVRTNDRCMSQSIQVNNTIYNTTRQQRSWAEWASDRSPENNYTETPRNEQKIFRLETIGNECNIMRKHTIEIVRAWILPNAHRVLLCTLRSNKNITHRCWFSCVFFSSHFIRRPFLTVFDNRNCFCFFLLLCCLRCFMCATNEKIFDWNSAKTSPIKKKIQWNWIESVLNNCETNNTIK